VRSIFSKHGGNLGETGSVSFNFDRLGAIQYDLDKGSADDMLEAAIEAGGDDVETTDDGHTIYCDPDELHQVGKVLEDRFGEASTMQILWRPKLEVPIDEDAGGTLLRMIDALEDSDDVQQVYANFDLSDDVLQKLTAA
jgi:transcriptional/translational regulatory protein YebC/TACO1